MTDPAKEPHDDPAEDSVDSPRQDPAGDSANGSRQDPAVIYPLVADSGNERVLRDWIAGHDEYAVAADEPLVESTCDICLVDQSALGEYKESITVARSTAKPALLPVLLLVSDLNSDLVDADQGQLADNVFATTVDELISLPIRQMELEWRLEALLRLREQSLDLQAQTEQLRQFQRAVEASGHAIWISGTDGTIEYVNPAFEAVTGYRFSEAVGNSPAILNSGEMPADHYQRLWDTVSAGEVWREDIINRRKDGSLYIADQTIAPIVDETGEPSAYVAVQTDITDRKELEKRLKRHRDIVQRLEDPIMLQDTEGQFILVNDALCEFAGLSADELEGTDEYAFMDQSTAQTIINNKETVLETEQPIEYSVTPTFEHSNKEAVFYTSRYPYYTGDDELAGTLAICRDVTDLEERTRQLHVLDNIFRHNIRNSLNIIYGQSEQLRAALDGDLETAAEAIIETAETLLTTSEKSRTITKILSDDVEVHQTNLSEILYTVVEETTSEWPESELSVSIPEQVTVRAVFPIRLAFGELLENAIRHNDHETPMVDVAVTVDEGMAEITVCDNGPGMSEFDRDVLESGEAIGELTHGSGLGLWVVYWAVKRSHGEITVDDITPRGTAISVSLPVATTVHD